MDTLLLSIGAVVIIIGCLIGFVLLVSKPKSQSAAPKKEPKKVSKAKKALKEIKEQAKGLPAPPAVPLVPAPGTNEVQGNISSLKEFPIGQKLDVEITRLVEGTLKRVAIAKGNVAIKSGTRPTKIAKLLFFVWQKGAQYYINPKKIIEVTSIVKGIPTKSYKLVYDILYGEALNKDGSITWDDDLELILADSGLDQYVTIAAFEGGFQFTPTLVRVMLIIAVLSTFLGLVLNGTNHFIPQTVIHWVP